MLELGLCCTFAEAPIRFRTTTVAYLKRCPDRWQYLDDLVDHNIEALHLAIDFCHSHQIGCFRINSQFLPCCTYPDVAYTLEDLAPGKKQRLQQCRGKIRLTFHPDQFVVLNSPHPEIVEKSIKELEYHAQLAQLVDADVINIHAGGVYGDKENALIRFEENLAKLSPTLRQRLTVENDDKSYTPADLLQLPVPLVYDVHHHRCLTDHLTIEEATEAALKTWNRRPLFHISSPIEGWKGKKPERHHDYIDPQDFPKCWLPLDLTVEVEAKAKEKALFKLQKDLKILVT